MTTAQILAHYAPSPSRPPSPSDAIHWTSPLYFVSADGSEWWSNANDEDVNGYVRDYMAVNGIAHYTAISEKQREHLQLFLRLGGPLLADTST